MTFLLYSRWCFQQLCFWPTLRSRGVARPLDSPEHFLTPWRSQYPHFSFFAVEIGGDTLLPTAGMSATLFRKSSLSGYWRTIECSWRKTKALSRPLPGHSFIQPYLCWPFKRFYWKCHCVMWGNMLRRQRARFTGSKLFIWGFLNWSGYVIRSLGGIHWA